MFITLPPDYLIILEIFHQISRKKYEFALSCTMFCNSKEAVLLYDADLGYDKHEHVTISFD